MGRPSGKGHGNMRRKKRACNRMRQYGEVLVGGLKRNEAEWRGISGAVSL